MNKQEMREFVEGLFLIQYIAKDDSESITQSNDFDSEKEYIDIGLGLLSPKIRYNSSGLYILSVTFNDHSMALRFAGSMTLYPWLKSFKQDDCKNLQENFNLIKLTITGCAMNISCDYEDGKELLIWLFKEIDRCKENIRKGYKMPSVEINQWKLNSVGI